MQFLLDALQTAGILLLVLLVFNFIILIHEWGHFLAARWRGLKIEKFQIWMGKPIWRRTWNGVQYGLGTIPLGGFVQLPQMAPMEAIEGSSGRFGQPLPPVKPLDKIIVAFAGPLFSFLLAVVFACAVWWAGKPVRPEEHTTTIGYVKIGEPAEKSGLLRAGDRILEIDGKPVERFFGLTHSVMWAIASGDSDDVTFKIARPGESAPRTVTVAAAYTDSPAYREWKEKTSWMAKAFSRPPLRRVGIAPALEGKVAGVEPHSPAAEAGLQKGDIILTVNGEKCYNPMFLYDLAAAKPQEPVVLTLQRGAAIVPATLHPRLPDTPKDATEARTGILLEELDPARREYSHPTPFRFVADCLHNTWATFKALVTPKSSIGVSQMSGPVGIMRLYYNIFQNPDWWRLLIWFSVVINISLAIFNLLPLPVLDGGHITMATLEIIRGKPLSTQILERIQMACVICLLGFVVFVSLKDVGGMVGDRPGEAESWLPRPAPAPAPAPAQPETPAAR